MSFGYWPLVAGCSTRKLAWASFPALLSDSASNDDSEHCASGTAGGGEKRKVVPCFVLIPTMRSVSNTDQH